MITLPDGTVAHGVKFFGVPSGDNDFITASLEKKSVKIASHVATIQSKFAASGDDPTCVIAAVHNM
jgi:hypothetical protein